MASKTIPQLTSVSVPASTDLLEISQGGVSYKATAEQVVEGSGLGLSAIADNRVLANVSGSSAVPAATSMSTLLDETIGSTQGQILYRNATVWTPLAPGTAGQVLTTGGAGANPSWGAAGSSATPLNNFSNGVPAVASFTWQNQNSATATDSSPSGKAIFMQAGGNSAGTEDINFLYLTSLPSTPYTITTYIEAILDPNSFASSNYLGWSDGTKYQVLRLAGPNAQGTPYLAVTRYSDSATFVSNDFLKVFYSSTPMWQQVADDGTNVFWRISLDGVNFVTVYTIDKASGYLGSGGYTRVGWGVNRRTNWGINPWATLRYWSTSTPAFP